MSTEQLNKGIRELIRSAPDETHVKIFLNQALGFLEISAKTLRACQRAAKIRTAQLKAKQ